MNDTKFAKITISMPQYLVDWIDAEAKKDDRSRSWMLAKMAKEIIEKRESASDSSKASDSSQTMNSQNKRKAS